MPGFRHILFPIDFSERCSELRPFVAAMARKFDSQVTLMHSVQTPVALYRGCDLAYPVMVDLEELEQDAERRLGSYFEGVEFGAGVQVKRAVEFGDPAVEIPKYVEEHDVDLVMMATHGYGKFRALLLGSVAAKVLHDVDCAVWTATHEEAAPLHAGCGCILCAVDLTKDCVHVMQRAAELGAAFGSRVRLVHAVCNAKGRPEDEETPDFNRFLLDAAREELARLQGVAGLKLEACLAGGKVSAVVRKAAEECGANLVVIGRGRIHQTMGRLRTNAYAIIRDSVCPVLSL